MDTTPGQPKPAVGGDSMDLVTQTRQLRRKVTFWRRAAWLILGAAAVFVVVFWNRGETRRRECRESLGLYAEIAAEVHLSEQHVDILEAQWNEFEPPLRGSSPMHYDLIARNWMAAPKPGESIPLAVCRDRHITTFSIGRHVLMKTEKGHRIVWLDEDAAEPIVEDARRDNLPR